ncbi:hypothetical protein GCM10025868_44400 [Angustibacter aerolatus]|uniref:L-seryl-tRNA selenium transferase N-terminal domain-containing protein n=1 Tax=Angustibacter aerolatus TaxID=1162965 RepID=A0ABQ6JLP6_9ACTN|nr:hypothetical protein [Angustibacter aerolatus]GMA89190.1 hypothetical protein GCM10025868_44400 [Angustibacter aerolatus]
MAEPRVRSSTASPCACPRSLAAPLRLGTPPVVGRVERGALLLDLRSLPAQHDAALGSAVLACAGTLRG